MRWDDYGTGSLPHNLVPVIIVCQNLDHCILDLPCGNWIKSLAFLLKHLFKVIVFFAILRKSEIWRCVLIYRPMYIEKHIAEMADYCTLRLLF